MRLFPGSLTAYALLIPLLVFFLFRGIGPALTEVDTDFPNYFTAAKIVADGREVSRVYDDRWFQSQIHSYGMKLEGKFTPFPPATALVFLPLSSFDPLTALRITTVVNAVLLVLSIRVLAYLLPLSLVESAAFVLLKGRCRPAPTPPPWVRR